MSQRSRQCCGFHADENLPYAIHISAKTRACKSSRHPVGVNASCGHLQRRLAALRQMSSWIIWSPPSAESRERGRPLFGGRGLRGRGSGRSLTCKRFPLSPRAQGTQPFGSNWSHPSEMGTWHLTGCCCTRLNHSGGSLSHASVVRTWRSCNLMLLSEIQPFRSHASVMRTWHLYNLKLMREFPPLWSELVACIRDESMAFAQLGKNYSHLGVRRLFFEHRDPAGLLPTSHASIGQASCWSVLVLQVQALSLINCSTDKRLSHIQQAACRHNLSEKCVASSVPSSFEF